MADYILVTDSTCDLPPQMVEDKQIEVIPMQLTMADQTYTHYYDARELGYKAFYDALHAGKTATTSQVNSAQFTSVVEPYLKDGKDVLYIAFSSGLSGTYNSARLAAEELTASYPDRKIYCVDSLCASAGEGMFVYYAALKKEQGMDIDTLRDWLEAKKLNMAHWFTVDDLQHLKRGGRISALTAVMGTALGIKPVMHVDNAGHLVAMSKVRGRRKSLDALYEHLRDTIIDADGQIVFIGHGDAKEDAEYLADLVKKNTPVGDVVITDIGPVIGAHSGPGTIALFFFGSKR